MPSKNDRSFCFPGLAIVFCFLIWMLGCTGFSVYRKSSSCTLCECILYFNEKFYTHAHTSTYNFKNKNLSAYTERKSLWLSGMCQVCEKYLFSLTTSVMPIGGRKAWWLRTVIQKPDCLGLNPGFHFTSFVVLCKWFNFTLPQFPHLQNGDNSTALLRLLWGVKEFALCIKHLEPCWSHVRAA